jgi:serine/threonine protein kinase
MQSTDYNFRSELGQGWAGVTWHGTLRVDKFGLRAGDDVAIKIYKSEIFKLAPNMRARIEREAETGLKIQHPNVMRAFALEEIDIDLIGKNLVLIMEFCGGGDLSSRLKSGSISGSNAYLIAEKLTRGVQALHDSGLIHRDIKPQNILFDNSNVPRIADFGVIRHIDEMTMTGSAEFLGTIRYAPPEVLSGESASFAGDIYSLGTVIYELLYGRAVFEEIALFSKLIVHITTQSLQFPNGPNRFTTHMSPIAVVLESICRRTLLRSPSERPSAATLTEWFVAGAAAPPFRQDLERAVFEVLKANRERWSREDGEETPSLFTDYSALALTGEMTDDDALEFMKDPSPRIIESNTAYRRLASAYLPRGREYVALPYALRSAVMRSLQEHHYDYVHAIWDEPSTWEVRDHEYIRFVSHYTDLETDTNLKEALASIQSITKNRL